jgi:membrane protein YqaA with SNARE-associated domain
MSLNATKIVSLPFLAIATIASAAFALLTPSSAYASPPTVTSFSCSNLPYGPEFVCVAAYNSNLPATVQWSGAEGTATVGSSASYFFGQCAHGDSVMVRVVVTNADGTATASTKRYRCIVS